MRCDPAVNATVTKDLSISINVILFAFTEYDEDTRLVAADTEGYITLIVSIWMDQAKNFDPSCGFNEYEPTLLHSLLSYPRWRGKIIEFSGGSTNEFLRISLIRIMANLGQREPDYHALRKEVAIFLSPPSMGKPWLLTALLSNSRSIETLIRVLSYTTQRPEERFSLLESSMTAITGIINFGGYTFALRAVCNDYLPLLVRAAIAYEKPDAPKLAGTEDTFSWSWAGLMPCLINRSCSSEITSSLCAIASMGLASKLNPSGAFAQKLGEFEARAKEWRAMALGYKERPRKFFYKCGNLNVSLFIDACRATCELMDSVMHVRRMKRTSLCDAELVGFFDIVPGQCMFLLYS